jgi:predicted RNase H-like nuclease (RuvC/YqgF family)
VNERENIQAAEMMNRFADMQQAQIRRLEEQLGECERERDELERTLNRVFDAVVAHRREVPVRSGTP